MSSSWSRGRSPDCANAPDALRATISPLDSIGPVIDAALLATPVGACRDQLSARFAHTDIRDAACERSLDPQGVVHTGSRWYLVVWDRAREDWRTFRIDRILRPIAAGHHFAPHPRPDGEDLKAFVSCSIAVSPYLRRRPSCCTRRAM